MLSFDIRKLETKPASVDGILEADDEVWDDADDRPSGSGVHVTGRLSSAGRGRFFFNGRIEGTAATECRRCLADVSLSIGEDVNLFFVESELDDVEDEDVYTIPAGAQILDLAPAIREEWLLSVPSFVLCKEDCRGLCATCGADRNIGECSCSPVTDSRWDALRAMRGSQP